MMISCSLIVKRLLPNTGNGRAGGNATGAPQLWLTHNCGVRRHFLFCGWWPCNADDSVASGARHFLA
jgi:hypothetical protein